MRAAKGSRLLFRRCKCALLSRSGRFALTVLACSGSGVAWAQVPVRQPALPAPGSPLPGIGEPQEPRLAPGLPRPPRPTAPAESTEGTTHQILNVTVDGVTAFPPS